MPRGADSAGSEACENSTTVGAPLAAARCSGPVSLPMARAALADRKAGAAEGAARLGLTTTTLYVYVNGDGTPKAAGQAVLDGTHRPGTAARAPTRPPPAPPLAAAGT